MREETAIRLTNFFDAGYVIKIAHGPYVTGNVTSMGRLDYDEDNSPYVYSDEDVTDRPLSEVDLSEVQLSKPISFYEETIEEIDPELENQSERDNTPNSEELHYRNIATYNERHSDSPGDYDYDNREEEDYE